MILSGIACLWRKEDSWGHHSGPPHLTGSPPPPHTCWCCSCESGPPADAGLLLLGHGMLDASDCVKLFRLFLNVSSDAAEAAGGAMTGALASSPPERRCWKSAMRSCCCLRVRV